MKPEQLKLYNKYKHKNYSDLEFIFIGVNNRGDYWFLYENKGFKTFIECLENYNLNSEQIIKDLNLEICFNYIKDYECYWCPEEGLINFQPMVKKT